MQVVGQGVRGHSLACARLAVEQQHKAGAVVNDLIETDGAPNLAEPVVVLVSWRSRRGEGACDTGEWGMMKPVTRTDTRATQRTCTVSTIKRLVAAASTTCDSFTVGL